MPATRVFARLQRSVADWRGSPRGCRSRCYTGPVCITLSPEADVALFLTEEEVAGLLPMSECMRVVEESFLHMAERKAYNMPRRRLHMPKGTLHFMPACDLELGTFGYKAYGSFRGSGVRFHFMLYDANDGKLLAIMEAGRLGQARTGAATGVAARYMSPPNAARLGIIGAGYQAESQLDAVCRALPIKEARVFSRTAEKREAFAKRMTKLAGVDVVPAASAEEAVRDAQAVVVITSSAEPVLLGKWLKPGMFVAAAGSNSLARREIDEEAVRKADLIVADDLEQAKLECGDLAYPVERGRIHWEQVRELKDVVSGAVKGYPKDGAITLFESQGLALEDVAAATFVYKHALEHGAGKQLPL